MPRPGAPALPTRKLSPSLEGLPTPPAFPWGWSLTDSTAGAPTLAAAVRTGRRGGRKRERGGEGAEEAAEEGGGEGREPTRGEERGGAAIPQRRSCALSHLPPPQLLGPLPDPSSLLTHFRPWIPQSFSGVPFSILFLPLSLQQK